MIVLLIWFVSKGGILLLIKLLLRMIMKFWLCFGLLNWYKKYVFKKLDKCIKKYMFIREIVVKIGFKCDEIKFVGFIIGSNIKNNIFKVVRSVK